MLSFDAKLVLRLSSRPKVLMKGEETMSDEWIADTIKRIKQSEEDKRRRESYALLREQKLAAHEYKLFEELQKLLKATVTKLNEQLPATEKRFDIKTSWDSIELIGPRELSFDIKHDSDAHQLQLELYVGSSSQPRIEGQVALDLNEDEEVRYTWEGRPISVTKLAQILLDLVVENSL
jgi:hypothetical protein